MGKKWKKTPSSSHSLLLSIASALLLFFFASPPPRRGPSQRNDAPPGQRRVLGRHGAFVSELSSAGRVLRGTLRKASRRRKKLPLRSTIEQARKRVLCFAFEKNERGKKNSSRWPPSGAIETSPLHPPTETHCLSTLAPSWKKKDNAWPERRRSVFEASIVASLPFSLARRRNRFRVFSSFVVLNCFFFHTPFAASLPYPSAEGCTTHRRYAFRGSKRREKAREASPETSFLSIASPPFPPTRLLALSRSLAPLSPLPLKPLQLSLPLLYLSLHRPTRRRLPTTTTRARPPPTSPSARRA